MLLDRLKATGCIFALFLGVFAFASAAQAGPEDGRIVNGSGSISQSGTHTDIRQNSDFLATHWGSFNIAAHESVQAHQPAASSRLLIRVDGGAATNIAGNYTSNGITILENQNGVQFSRGAIVNVGGLLATSSRISGVAGANWQLDGTGGAVANHGTITAGAGGAILAAVKVQNTGDITAKGGDVALGAGSSFTVDFAGSMVGFEIRQAASGASITNSGKIEAQGGVVALSAQEAQAVRTNVVSVGGVVKATRIERRGGVVYLSGGDEGIAEVSGDVSASEKVQTTGEYVVVKEGALLKAPEILVGGDFQGKGDVPTARRTLVERGALLDADANGRVIVWSDETTWFNGNITAPEGFAEVSGKKTLASVNLAGIDVGKLLLDPADIIIAASGTAVSGNIAAADAPSGTLTLAVASINGFTGDLSLAATGLIRVNAPINKPTGGLTLTAGGVLMITVNITTSAGDLALTGTNGIVLGGTAPITLSGGAVLLTGAIDESAPTTTNGKGGNDNLNITATGDITINDDINLGTGVLHLSAGRFGTGDVIARDATLTLTASEVQILQDRAFGTNAPFTFITDALRLGAFVDQTVQGWMTSGNRSLLLSVRTLTITEDISTGTGYLNLFGFVPGGIGIILVGDIELMGDSIRLGGTIDESAGTADANGRGGNDALTIRATGELVFFNNINTGTGALSLSGDAISLGIGGGNSFSLDGGAITLTGMIAREIVSGSPIRAVDLTITAGGRLTLNSGINLGVGTLTINAGERINVANENTVITAGAFAINFADQPAVQNPAEGFTIGDTATLGNLAASSTTPTFTFANAGTPPVDSGTPTDDCIRNGEACSLIRDNANLETADHRLESDVSITIDIGSGTLSFGGPGVITIEADTFVSITAGNINLGRSLKITANGGVLTLNTSITATGELILSGSTIVLGGTTPISLEGRNVMLTGALTANAPDLTVTATTGALTLNDNINTGTGDLTLSGTSIVLGGTAPITLSGGAVTLTGAITRTDNAPLTITASGRLTLNSGINLGVGALMINAGERINLVKASTIIRAGTFTINFTDPAVRDPDAGFTIGGSSTLGNLAASSTTPTFTFTNSAPVAPVVDCVTGDGACMLGTGATINLLTDDADLASSDSITISIGSGTLTFGGGLAPITIEAPTVSITAGNIDIGTRALTITASGGVLTLATRITADAGSTAAVELTATGGALTLGGAVNARGGNIILRGMDVLFPGSSTVMTPGIQLGSAIGFSSTITLTGAAITLTGTIDESVSGNNANDALTVRATGVLTLNDNIRAHSLRLSGMRIVLGSDINLLAGRITLTGMIDESGTGGNDSLTVGRGSVTFNSDINLGTGDLTLNGGSIVLGERLTRLEGHTVSLTGAISRASGIARLTIRTGGNITINSNINLGTGSLFLITSCCNNNIVVVGTPTLTAGTVTLRQDGAFVADQFAIASATSLTLTTRAAQTVYGWMVADGRDLSLTAGRNIMVSDDINIGSGNLTLIAGIGSGIVSNILSGAGTQTLTAATVSLRQNRSAFADNLFEIDSATTSLTLVAGSANIQTVHIWMVNGTNRALSIRTRGVLTIGRNIDTGSGNLTLSGATIVLSAPVELRGAAITLTGAIDESAGTADANGKGGNDALTVTATGDITINDDINLGPDGELTLFAGMGGSSFNRRNILSDPDNTETLTAGTVSLRQDDAFGDTFAGPTGTFRISTSTLNLLVEAFQSVHNWMVVLNRSLSVTSRNTGVAVSRDIVLGTGDLTLSGLGNISINGGARTLSGGAITLTGTRIFLSGATTLTGGAITLTGAIDESGARGNDALTITATGDITINDDINLGPDGELTLFAGMGGNALNRGNILSDPDNTETLTAGTVSLRQIDAFDDTFSGPDGTFRIGISTSTLKLWASDSQGVRNWMVVSNRSLSITSDFRVTVGRDIDLGTGDLTLGDDLIVITGARTLSGGAIKLEGKIRSSSGTLTVTATDLLTLNHNINVGTGDLALSGGSIVLVSNITLDGGAITLTGAIDGSSTGNDSLTIRASGVLTLNDNINTGTGDLALSGGSIVLGGTAPITLDGGAVTLTGAINPFFRISAASLTVTATGQLTLNSDIKTGRRIDLTLSGRTITLGGTINLSGGAITLTGAIDASDDGYSFTITADGGNITINNSINLGEGILNLGASGFSEVTGSGTPTLTASTVALRNGVVFSQNAQFRFATNTLSLTVGGIQTVYDWMVADGRNLRLRANGGVIVTGDINIGSATLIFEVCCGNIHAIGTGTPTLTAGAVSFTQSGDFAEAALFRFASSVRALNLTTDALNLPPGVETQAVHGWMVADGRSLSLTTTFGAIMVNADINTGTGNLTLSGSSGISINGARTLSGGAITLTGEIARAGNAALVITATGGALTFNSSFNTGTGALTLSGTSIVLGGTAPITLSGGAVTLTGAATGAANLTITASGTLRLNNNITLTGTDLTLALSGAGAIVNGGTATLTASTVSLEQDAVFTTTEPFAFGNTGSLELTTDAAQVVHDWMIAMDRDLTVTSARTVFVRSAIVSGNRNLGAGSLTLESTGGGVRILADISTGGDLTLNGATGINLNGRAAKTLSGAGITLTGTAQSNRALTITASGTLRFNNNITLNGERALSLTSTGGDVRILGNITTGGELTLIGGTGGINFNGRAAKTFSGANITLTGVVVSNRAVTLTASGILRLNNNIALTGTRALSLSGSGGITLGSALTTLSGGAITLRGAAATGTADLTITARGALTINNDIGIGTNALTLTSGAGAISNGGAVRVLTASTVSLSQEAAFVGARPFSFGTTTTDLLITTDAAQDVFNWMITSGRNLTVTSALNVIVRSAIGDGLGARDLGDGSLILRSTGGVVRIFADISTMGDLTLDASTFINLNGGGAKTLSGAIVTLTGAARSNRALTINATTFALGDAMSTINVVGANVLTIEADSSLPASLTGNGRLTAGTLTLSFPCPDATCVDTTP